MNRRLFFKTSAAFLSLPLWSQALLELAEAQGLRPGSTQQSLRNQEFQLLEILVDVIIPKSQLPGTTNESGSEAEVHHFIDQLMTVANDATRTEFVRGLTAFENWIQSDGNQTFFELPESVRHQRVNSLLSSVAVPTVSDWMKTLKLLTLYGYRNWSQFYNQDALTTRYLGPEELA